MTRDRRFGYSFHKGKAPAPPQTLVSQEEPAKLERAQSVNSFDSYDSFNEEPVYNQPSVQEQIYTAPESVYAASESIYGPGGSSVVEGLKAQLMNDQQRNSAATVNAVAEALLIPSRRTELVRFFNANPTFTPLSISAQISEATLKDKSIDEETAVDYVKSLIPTIRNEQQQDKLMTTAIQYLSDSATYHIIGKMMSSNWNPSQENINLALRKKNVFAVRLFLDKDIQFSARQASEIGRMFLLALDTSNGKDRSIVDMFLHKLTLVPGAETKAVEFLIRDKKMDNSLKKSFFINSILQSIPESAKLPSHLKLAVRKKRFDLVEIMLNNGWQPTLLNNNEMSQVAADRLADNVNESLGLQSQTQIKPKKPFWKKLFS
jgi:hypothetical protein